MNCDIQVSKAFPFSWFCRNHAVWWKCEETPTLCPVGAASSQLVATSQALRKLANEAEGFLAIADRETHGSTNVAVLKLRIEEARAALTPAAPAKEES